MELSRKVVFVLVVKLLLWDSAYSSLESLSSLSRGAPSSVLRNLKISPIDGLALYLPINVDPNSTCGQGIQHMLDSLEDYDGVHPTWTHKIVDSWGKSTGGGFAFGNTGLPGSYSECLYTSSPSEDLHGKYCQVYLRKKYKPGAIITLPRVPGTGADWHQAINNVIIAQAGDEIQYGTCIPDVCTDKDLKESMKDILDEVQVSINLIKCSVTDPPVEFTPGDIGFLILLSVLALLLVSASICDIYIKVTKDKNLPEGPVKFLLPFSAYTNIEKLFNIKSNRSPGNITCLNAMRVLSMIWVMYGHQQTGYIYTSYNTLDITSKINGFFFQIISNGYLSVDTFFFMSGLLVCYNILKEVKKTGRFNVFLFYMHRLVRLLPTLALIVGFYSTIVRFFVSGPQDMYWDQFQKTCQKAWWRELLFITNFSHDPVGEGLGASCLSQSWYLGVDTQLYLVSPLLALPLFYHSPSGEAWLYIMAIVSCLIPASITYKYDLPPTTLLYFEPREPAGYIPYTYLMPYTRASPYIVGMAFGYLLCKQGNRRSKLQSWQVVTGWTAALGAFFMVIFSLWNYNTYPPMVWPYDRVTQIIYAGFHRGIWALALGWVVIACHNGYGGIADDFLSHPIWQPLSRMTFTIFLVSLLMQDAIICRMQIPNYFTHYNKIIETVGALVIAAVVSTLVIITVEAPIITLEKLLLRPRSRGKEENTPTMAQKDILSNS